MNRAFAVKLSVSFLLFVSELVYLFFISGFFRDAGIVLYFSRFNGVRLFFMLIPPGTWLVSSLAFTGMVYNKYIFLKPESGGRPKIKKNKKTGPETGGMKWPEGGNGELKLVIGEIHDKDGTRKEKPEWLVMDKKGLYTGMLVLGATGTGKTSACAYPFLEQLAAYRRGDCEGRIGGLVLDVKGDFWKEAAAILKRNGRNEDIVMIEPGSGYYFNPIHYPALDAKIIAERLYSVLENMNSGDGRQDSFWKDKSINLLSNSISLIRSCLGYATLSDVYGIISDEGALGKLLKHAQNVVKAREGRAGEGRAGKACVTGRTEKAAAGLNLSEKMKAEAEINETKLAAAYFSGGDYAGLDERTRAIIKSESLRVCSDFIKPVFRETFCPPEEQLNFPGFREAVDKGKIVILNMPESKYGLTGKTVGIMLKLDYFRTVLNRVNAALTDETVNVRRPVLFICDEYQNYVTSGDIESDAEFFARCRQSKAINILLSQSYSSLKLKLGSEEKLNSLIGNIRSTIWLALSDDYSREKASKICDKEFKIKITENVTEQDDGASFNPYIGRLISDDNTISQGTTRTYEKMPSFDTDDFARLKLNQAVYRIDSGEETAGPGIVYLHPIYRPKTRSYFD